MGATATVHQKNYRKLMRTTAREKHEMAFLFGCRTRQLPTPEKQHRFHPTRLWRLDFAWPQSKLGVEIEGGIWRKDKRGNWAGAHSHPTNIERDIEKGNALTMTGWHLLRATEKQIKDGSIFEMVKEFLVAAALKS